MSSIAKAVTVLEFLSGKPDGCGVIQMSKELNMPASSIHRMLTEMMLQGLVQQAPPPGKSYFIGPRLLTLGSTFLRQSNISAMAHHHVVTISDTLQETAFFALLNNDNVICTDMKMMEHEGLSFYIDIGRIMPPHRSTSSWAIMAFLPPDQAARMLKGQDYTDLIPGVPQSEAEVLDKLTEARLNHYAVGIGLFDAGVICIGVPVWDYLGRVIGSLNVLGSINKLGREEIRPRAAAILQAEAGKLSYRLGYAPEKTGSF